MEGVLRPTSLTVRYVPLYEGSQPLRFAVARAKSCNSRNRGGQRPAGPPARIIFHGWFFVRGWAPPAFQHPLLSYPYAAPRRSLLADPVDRVHAWHLSSEIPLFRRETNEKLPLSLLSPPPFFSHPLTPVPATANTVFSTLSSER